LIENLRDSKARQIKKLLKPDVKLETASVIERDESQLNFEVAAKDLGSENFSEDTDEK